MRIDFVKDWFTRVCKVCESKDYQIAYLKEQIRDRDLTIKDLLNELSSVHNTSQEMLRKVMKLDINLEPKERTEHVPLKRRSSYSSRIQQAERKDLEQNANLINARKAEYSKRIQGLEIVEVKNE